MAVNSGAGWCGNPDSSDIVSDILDEAPEGMSIDENGGLISWPLHDVTPGEYIIAIVVTDPDGAETAQEYSLTLGAQE